MFFNARSGFPRYIGNAKESSKAKLEAKPLFDVLILFLK
jgi:hypothetical protein